MRKNLENQGHAPCISELLLIREQSPTSREVYVRKINPHLFSHYGWIFCFVQLNVILTDHSKQFLRLWNLVVVIHSV